MQSEKPLRNLSLDGLRALLSIFVSRLRQQFERRLSLHNQQSEEEQKHEQKMEQKGRWFCPSSGHAFNAR
jgi:hypothetical protein